MHHYETHEIDMHIKLLECLVIVLQLSFPIHVKVLGHNGLHNPLLNK